VAERLLQATRKADFVVRLGGDEAEWLLKTADLALYQPKAEGLGILRRF